MKWEGGKMWEYLGDGIYAGYDGFGVWLHANSHDTPTDRIYLEPAILAALNSFINSFKEEGIE